MSSSAIRSSVRSTAVRATVVTGSPVRGHIARVEVAGTRGPHALHRAAVARDEDVDHGRGPAPRTPMHARRQAGERGIVADGHERREPLRFARERFGGTSEYTPRWTRWSVPRLTRVEIAPRVRPRSAARNRGALEVHVVEVCEGTPQVSSRRCNGTDAKATKLRRLCDARREVHDHRRAEHRQRAEELDGAERLAEGHEHQRDGHGRLERREDRRRRGADAAHAAEEQHDRARPSRPAPRSRARPSPEASKPRSSVPVAAATTPRRDRRARGDQRGQGQRVELGGDAVGDEDVGRVGQRRAGAERHAREVQRARAGPGQHQHEAAGSGDEGDETPAVGRFAPEEDRRPRHQCGVAVEDQGQDGRVHALQRQEVQAGLHRVADRAQRQRPHEHAALGRAGRRGGPRPRPRAPARRSRSGPRAGWRRRRPPRRRACRRSASHRRRRPRRGRGGLRFAAACDTHLSSENHPYPLEVLSDYRAHLLHDARPQTPPPAPRARAPRDDRRGRRRRSPTARPRSPSSSRSSRRRPACRCSSASGATCG